ncbi:hypothetical protein D3C73_1078410 [compost metagenome]
MELAGPQRGVGEDIEEATHQGTRVVDVLRGQWQPLGDQALFVQATGGQLIEVPGIQVDHAGSGGRWRFQGDQVVGLRVAQQFLATVAQAHVDTRVGSRIEVALEQGRRVDH